MIRCLLNPTHLVLYSIHNTGIFVPFKQRVLAALRLRLFQVGPAAHELLVRHDPGQLAGDGLVDEFRHAEVCGEHNIEIALMYL